MKAPILQGLTGSPSYFGLLNNLMTLIICESLREIGDMACVTSAWSSRGQTLKFNFIGFESCQNSERMSDFLMNNQHVQETKKNVETSRDGIKKRFILLTTCVKTF